MGRRYRATANRVKALQRLAHHLPRVAVKPARKRGWYAIRVNGGRDRFGLGTIYKRASHALAFLADLARRQGLDPAIIRWRGTIPTRGMSAWEESALRWLQTEE